MKLAAEFAVPVSTDGAVDWVGAGPIADGESPQLVACSPSTQVVNRVTSKRLALLDAWVRGVAGERGDFFLRFGDFMRRRVYRCEGATAGASLGFVLPAVTARRHPCNTAAACHKSPRLCARPPEFLCRNFALNTPAAALLPSPTQRGSNEHPLNAPSRPLNAIPLDSITDVLTPYVDAPAWPVHG